MFVLVSSSRVGGGIINLKGAKALHKVLMSVVDNATAATRLKALLDAEEGEAQSARDESDAGDRSRAWGPPP